MEFLLVVEDRFKCSADCGDFIDRPVGFCLAMLCFSELADTPETAMLELRMATCCETVAFFPSLPKSFDVDSSTFD